jgi:tRNA pseudouridine38-40 synthase
MLRYKLEIEYYGKQYYGMQSQKDLPSIQDTIVDALSWFLKQKIEVLFSGRTDAGVNAYNQILHFNFPQKIEECKAIRSINFFLKDKQIVVINMSQVEENFHSRFNAIKRQYCYKILLRKSPTAIENELLWHIHYDLDLVKFITESKYFIGSHNFHSFRSIKCQAKNPNRAIDFIQIRISHFITKDRILEIKYLNRFSIITKIFNLINLIKLRKINNNLNDYMIYGLQVEFRIIAKSFLHHMIRNIVGTLYDKARGRITQSISDIIQSKDRCQAGQTAPACGLYFLGTEY